MTDSVYIHIPFCKHICTYCDFCKMLYNEEYVIKYLVALNNEIKDKYNNEELETLYIGGGTPSALSPKSLLYLMNIIKIFKLKDIYEFTFECNIYDINEELLQVLKDNGVNRLSIGIESFNEDNLALMERECNFNDTLNKINLCRKMGFNNINLDLIYALPFETISTLKKDITNILKLNPEHISTYSLQLEDNTLLKIKGYESINEDLDFKMYKTIMRKLKWHGYNHYEVSNFAKKGYESKHNLNCWHNNEYYGFGLSASGYYEGVRYNNTLNLFKFFEGNYTNSKEIVGLDDQKKYALMLGLRLMNGINVSSFNEKYQTSLLDYKNVSDLLKTKELILKKDNLIINPKKIYVMNSILVKLI